jgi:predicted negative regulator of RcsB-dependent stress response
MATQSATPRPRPSVNDDDVFVTRAIEFSVWAKKNIQLIVGIGIVLLVLVIGLLWYRADRANKMERAATEFLSLQQMVQVGEPAAAAAELNTYIQRHAGTTYADEARILLGQLHLNTNNAAEAVTALSPFGDRVGRTPLATQGALLLAASQQAAGNAQAAVQTYLRVADRADLPLEQQDALSNAALIRQEAGDYAGAAELYRRLVATAEVGTFERSVFEMRLAEAEAAAVQQ